MVALILTPPSLNPILPKLQHSFGSILDKSLLVRSKLVVTVQGKASWWENLKVCQHHFLKCFVFVFTMFFFKNLKDLPKSKYEPVKHEELSVCSPHLFLPTLVQHGGHCQITVIHLKLIKHCMSITLQLRNFLESYSRGDKGDNTVVEEVEICLWALSNKLLSNKEETIQPLDPKKIEYNLDALPVLFPLPLTQNTFEYQRLVWVGGSTSRC